MKVTILGSGSATPFLGRHPSSLILEYEHYYYLFDSGEAVQWRLLENNIKISRINHIFISHLHGDHYLGLMGLLSSMNSLGRKSDLLLFVPPGLKDILLIQFKYQDTRLEFKIILKETSAIPNQVLWENNKLIILSYPLNHRIPTTGFLVKEKPKELKLMKEKLPSSLSLQNIQRLKNGLDVLDDAGNIMYKSSQFTFPTSPIKSFAYCTDTIFDVSLVPYLQNVDVLYHEATFLDDKKDRANKTHHSTAMQAATIAKAANVKKLIIGHFSSRYKELEPFQLEASSVFPNTELSIEGRVFEI